MQKIPTSVFAVKLAAMRSVCLEGLGRVSEILLTDGKQIHDPRRNRALLEAMARHYAVDLVALRQHCNQLLYARNYMPIPFSSEMVLVPLALGQCGERMGYINLLAVEAVHCQGRSSRVEVTTGAVVDCALSRASVRNRLLRAQLVLRELEGKGMLASPADTKWRSKLDLIRAVLAEE